MERKRFCITGLLIFFCLFISTFQVEGDNYLILEYSTYLGGNGTEGHGILFFNSSDQLIVVSETSSTNYPLLNPYQNSNHGVRDITISLHAWKENILTYSTFFGGDGDDFVSRAIMNSKGQIIMVGVTDSSDFPLINSLAINSTGRDVFIVIFDPQISNFTFSSLLGSASNYYGINVCIDSLDNIIISGTTDSESFSIINGYQTSIKGDSDGFIMKLSSDGQEILYSTYFGGSMDESIKAVTVDGQNNIIFTGVTQSTDFPIFNAYLADKSVSIWDIFIVKMTANGQQVIFSTFHGGTRVWGPQIVRCDSLDNILVVGETNSIDFPLLKALQNTYGGGEFDVFLSKFNPNGSELDYSTFLGGKQSETPISFTLDHNLLFITGCTDSLDFPQVNEYQLGKSGAVDGFMTAVTTDGQKLAFSTFFGDLGNDYISDLIFLPEVSHSFFISGHTSSRNFPLHEEYQSSYGGGEFDLFISQFSLDLSFLSASTESTSTKSTNIMKTPVLELFLTIPTFFLVIIRKRINK